MCDNTNSKQMIFEKTWEEFRRTGLLWWINRALHVFGWAIILEINADTEKVQRAYPARCKFRGFREEDESEGFVKLANYMEEKATILKKESLLEKDL